MQQAEHLQEGAYDSGSEYEEYIEEEDYVEDDGEEHDGEIVDVEDDEEVEEGEEDGEGGAAAGGGGGGGGGGQGQQMLFIPGLGYFPLSSLGNIPGLAGLRGAQQQGALPQQPEGPREWESFDDFPEETRATILDVLGELREDGREELTVLLLGKGGVGKSSTINTLLNERAAQVTAFQAQPTKPLTYSRVLDGFTLNLIDTPSLLDQDAVSDRRLEAVAKAVDGRPVDVVLYLDRLDNYSLGPLDKRVLAGISRVLGPSIWSNTILCFSRASEGAAPPGVGFDDFVDQRATQLRTAIEQVGGQEAELPVALLENSSRCPVNEAGEKVVPNGAPWVVDLLRQVKDVALNFEAWEYDPKAAAKAANPDRRRKWLIPLVLLAQVALKLLLDRVMEEDGVRGDANGPFDSETVKERREELRQDKEEKKKKQEREKRSRSAAGPAVPSRPLYDFDDETEEEEDDY